MNKLPSVFVFAALAAFFPACEEHPASQLALLEPHHDAGEHHGSGHTATHAPAHGKVEGAGHDDAEPREAHAPGAPKYFPEKKQH